MSRVAVTPITVTRDGVADPAEVDGDAGNGHTVSNDGHTVVKVRNADSGAAHNVTFETRGSVDGEAIADRVVSVGASASLWFGPFPAGVYGSSVLIDVASSQLKLTAYQI